MPSGGRREEEEKEEESLDHTKVRSPHWEPVSHDTAHWCLATADNGVGRATGQTGEAVGGASWGSRWSLRGLQVQWAEPHGAVRGASKAVGGATKVVLGQWLVSQEQWAEPEGFTGAVGGALGFLRGGS